MSAPAAAISPVLIIFASFGSVALFFLAAYGLMTLLDEVKRGRR